MTDRDHWTEAVVDADGVKIQVHRAGDGKLPSLVLAHGLSDNGLCWRRTAHALADVFDVVMIDARNHGRSGRAPGGIAAQANDVAAVIGALGLDRPAAMGHSMGASTVAVLAADHPDLVSRVVLEDPPWRDTTDTAGTSTAEAWKEISAFLQSFAGLSDTEIVARGRSEHPDWSEAEFPDWAAAKQEVGELAVGNIDAPDWSSTVSRIECPTLLIHGEIERGGIVDPAVARRATELNPSLSTRRVRSAGHNIRRERFDEFIIAARAFLLETL